MTPSEVALGFIPGAIFYCNRQKIVKISLLTLNNFYCVATRWLPYFLCKSTRRRMVDVFLLEKAYNGEY